MLRNFFLVESHFQYHLTFYMHNLLFLLVVQIAQGVTFWYSIINSNIKPSLADGLTASYNVEV